MRCAIRIVLATLAAGCAADEGIRTTDSGVGTPMAGQVSSTAGMGGSSSSLAGFGSNPGGTIIPVTPLPPDDSGMPMSMDASQCEVGKFCGPAGPDPDNCGTLRLEQDVEVTREPGNLLIIFDQSLSMNEPFGTSTKIVAAQEALARAITALQDSLTVGAIFFPTLGCIPALPSVSVDAIESPNQIAFQPGPMFLQAWNAHWQMIGGALGVGTPMNEAFDVAEVALSKANLTGATAVVAFTDGAPNCIPDPATSMIPTMFEPDRAANWLMSRNVKTYVVGLPGAAGVQLLNDVAMAGGTTEYILPDDPAQLEAKLREVVSETVKKGFNTCSINLKPAADPVDKLQMVVEENGMRLRVDRMLAPDAGWSISSDGTKVEITGRLCDDAKAGRFESITFEYGCKDIPPLTPERPI